MDLSKLGVDFENTPEFSKESVKRIIIPKDPNVKLLSFSERWEEELKEQLFKKSSVNNEEVKTILEEEFNYHKPRPNEEWDVPKDEKIKYFDPELSYELTGYRPITMTKGLDFDPIPFKEAAILYDTTGDYCKHFEGSKLYDIFWSKQLDRCTNGYTVGKYRITGDNYFFLNFYRMNVIQEDAKGGAGRKEAFPSFVAKQYEFFHYIEMAELLHKDVGALKARGVGWSEVVACLAVRPYTTNEKYQTKLTAASKVFLDPLKYKCWFNLDWLNSNTKGAFKQLRLVINNDDAKRASMRNSEGTEYGSLSEISATVVDDSAKLRGSRLDRLIMDEAGSNSCLTETWIKGNALVELGGFHQGLRIFLGTGGDVKCSGGLATMFNNPSAYNVLPYKNYDTGDGTPKLSAFFLPAHKFSLLKEYVDSRGVTDYKRFKLFYEEQRKLLTDRDYFRECAEHCFNPKEALANTGSTVFDPTLIAERMVQIKVSGKYKPPKKYILTWDDARDITHSKVTAHESDAGQLLVIEPPLVDETIGKPFNNLYVAGIDAIDMGKDDSASDTNVSDFCVVVKKRLMGSHEPRYVAMYKYRPNDIRQAYDLTMKLLVWYNCKAMLEYTKISIQMYFKEKNMSKLFMQRPQSAMNASSKRVGKNLIGMPATETYIRHGLELVGAFINDWWYTIDFEEMLDQMLNYTYEDKRKFDIIASMQINLHVCLL